MPSTPPGTSVEPSIYCKQCGYDLRACLENRCSECGRKYDPADPKTFAPRPPRQRSWLKRGLAALLTVLVLLGGAYGWLYWEWHEEQQALTKLTNFNVYKSIALGPEWLNKCLGSMAFVLERVTSLGGIRQKVTNDQLVALKDVKWLEDLYFYETPVSDLNPLAKLTALQTFSCTFTKVSDLSPLAKLTALQLLNCSSTKVSDLSPLAKLMALQILLLNNTPVSDISPLANLTSLKELDCCGTKISDLSPLFKLTALRVLGVPKETISEAQVQELQKALPNCQIGRY